FSEIRAHAPSYGRERVCEFDHLAEFRIALRADPLRMIAMLSAPARVAPHRLQMSVGARSDPHVVPRRRNDERSNPVERSRVANRAPLRVAIGERFSMSNPRESRLPFNDVVQAGGPCRRL